MKMVLLAELQPSAHFSPEDATTRMMAANCHHIADHKYGNLDTANQPHLPKPKYSQDVIPWLERYIPLFPLIKLLSYLEDMGCSIVFAFSLVWYRPHTLFVVFDDETAFDDEERLPMHVQLLIPDMYRGQVDQIQAGATFPNSLEDDTAVVYNAVLRNLGE